MKAAPFRGVWILLSGCSLPCNSCKPLALQGFEQVRKLHVDSEPFSVENGLTTPTFKHKRPQLLKHYKAEIDRCAMYDSLCRPPSHCCFTFARLISTGTPHQVDTLSMLCFAAAEAAAARGLNPPILLSAMLQPLAGANPENGLQHQSHGPLAGRLHGDICGCLNKMHVTPRQ